MQTGHFFPVIYTKSSLNILAKFNEARGREEAALARNGLCSGVIIEREKKALLPDFLDSSYPLLSWGSLWGEKHQHTSCFMNSHLLLFKRLTSAESN